MKDKEKIKIAREETDLEWRPVLDGVHAYADLRRLGRRLATERHVTDETIARLRQALEEATRALTVDPPYLSPARVGTARSILAAALAGEGEGASDA